MNEREALAQWRAEAPALVAALCRDWELRIDGSAMAGETASVVPVRTGCPVPTRGESPTGYRSHRIPTASEATTIVEGSGSQNDHRVLRSGRPEVGVIRTQGKVRAGWFQDGVGHKGCRCGGGGRGSNVGGHGVLL